MSQRKPFDESPAAAAPESEKEVPPASKLNLKVNLGGGVGFGEDTSDDTKDEKTEASGTSVMPDETAEAPPPPAAKITLKVNLGGGVGFGEDTSDDTKDEKTEASGTSVMPDETAEVPPAAKMTLKVNLGGGVGFGEDTSDDTKDEKTEASGTSAGSDETAGSHSNSGNSPADNKDEKVSPVSVEMLHISPSAAKQEEREASTPSPAPAEVKFEFTHLYKIPRLDRKDVHRDEDFALWLRKHHIVFPPEKDSAADSTADSTAASDLKFDPASAPATVVNSEAFGTCQRHFHELAKNWLDAGVTEVKLTITEKSAGTVEISIQDNGTGFTKYIEAKEQGKVNFTKLFNPAIVSLAYSVDSLSLLSGPLSEESKQEAQKHNRPILIKDGNDFWIYGDQTGNGKTWDLTYIVPFVSAELTAHLNKLPFAEGELKRDNPLFNELLPDMIKLGHASGSKSTKVKSKNFGGAGRGLIGISHELHRAGGTLFIANAGGAVITLVTPIGPLVAKEARFVSISAAREAKERAVREAKARAQTRQQIGGAKPILFLVPKSAAASTQATGADDKIKPPTPKPKPGGSSHSSSGD